jgi:hypothetical protein
MNIGDKVKIKAPFNIAFGDTYEIIGVAEAADTYTVGVNEAGSDFHIDFLEAV